MRHFLTLYSVNETLFDKQILRRGCQEALRTTATSRKNRRRGTRRPAVGALVARRAGAPARSGGARDGAAVLARLAARAGRARTSQEAAWEAAQIALKSGSAAAAREEVGTKN